MRCSLAVVVAISIFLARAASAEQPSFGAGRPLTPLHPGGLARVGSTRASALSSAGGALERWLGAKAAPPRPDAPLLPRKHTEQLSFGFEMRTCSTAHDTMAPTTLAVRVSLPVRGEAAHVDVAAPAARPATGGAVAGRPDPVPTHRGSHGVATSAGVALMYTRRHAPENQ